MNITAEERLYIEKCKRELQPLADLSASGKSPEECCLESGYCIKLFASQDPGKSLWSWWTHKAKCSECTGWYTHNKICKFWPGRAQYATELKEMRRAQREQRL